MNYNEPEERLSNRLGGNSSDRTLFCLLPLLTILRFIIITSILIVILMFSNPDLGLVWNAAKHHSKQLIEEYFPSF